jgi:hypothetical protein
MVEGAIAVQVSFFRNAARARQAGPICETFCYCSRTVELVEIAATFDAWLRMCNVYPLSSGACG